MIMPHATNKQGVSTDCWSSTGIGLTHSPHPNLQRNQRFRVSLPRSPAQQTTQDRLTNRVVPTTLRRQAASINTGAKIKSP